MFVRVTYRLLSFTPYSSVALWCFLFFAAWDFSVWSLRWGFLCLPSRFIRKQGAVIAGVFSEMCFPPIPAYRIPCCTPPVARTPFFSCPRGHCFILAHMKRHRLVRLMGHEALSHSSYCLHNSPGIRSPCVLAWHMAKNISLCFDTVVLLRCWSRWTVLSIYDSLNYEHIV